MATVRRYRASDWEDFLALDLDTGLLGERVSNEDAKAFRERWPGVLKGHFNWGAEGPGSGHGEVFVLEAERGEYAGHIWLSEQPDLFTGVRRLFVTTLAITQAHRRKGYGMLLMNKAEDEARTRGLAEVSLGVTADNEPAIQLYESLGFSTTRLSMRKRLPLR